MRKPWNVYFMDMAKLAAQRSTCMRRQVGAVAVRDRHVLATGYNGAPRGVMHCEEVGCLREQLGVPSGQRQEICRAVHAEQNVIAQAAKQGVSLDGATLYCTHMPCVTCLKMLINAGIKTIFFEESYPDGLSKDMLEGSQVEMFQLPPA